MTKTARAVAWFVCRLYAVLPCVITALVGGLLCASGHGVWWAAALTLGAFLVMTVRFRDFLERPGMTVANALVFFLVLAAPSALLPWRGVVGFGAGTLAEAALDVALLAVLPRLPAAVSRGIQPELYADVLTGLLIAALFGLPARLVLRRSPCALPPPPWDVVVVLCAFQEEATIFRSIESIERAVAQAARSPLVRSARVVLVDSSPDPQTRELLASRVARALAGPAGKLSARHSATQLEAADVILAADADRTYDPSWIELLLAPLASGAVASMGETRNWGGAMSGSALTRSLLRLPFNGGNSAYFRDAYLADPFDPTIDEFNHRQLWLEEEFRFGLKLRAQGRVVHVPECRSYELRPYPILHQMARHLLGRRLRTF